MKPLRIGIYLRVSTLDQSTELQARELNTYVASRGWGKAAVYEDAGKSGTTANRPRLRDLMRDARERKLDVVVCWKLDRLFRSLKDLVVTLQEFKELGIDFISIKDNIDLTTSAGRLMLHIIGAFGEFEASLIRERVRAGLANARAKGKRLGRPKRVINPKVSELRRAGLTIRAIAKELEIPRSTVADMLSGKTRLKTG